VRTAGGGGGGGGEDRTTAEAETTRTPTGIQNTFLSADCCVVLRTLSHGPGRPAHAAADEALLDAGKQSDLLAALASQLRRPVEGGARWSDGRYAVLAARARSP
jgi:hypothetical protein